jgi:antitoxin ParD1/3/4/toxin ParE1/3/4
VKYLLSGPAKKDLWGIWEYLAERSDLTTADRVVEELHQAMERLAESPGLGHLRRDLAREPLRFWKVRSYLVVYRPDTSPLEVVRILPGSRDVEALLEQDPLD